MNLSVEILKLVPNIIIFTGCIAIGMFAFLGIANSRR
jgi:hypothetical protein